MCEWPSQTTTAQFCRILPSHFFTMSQPGDSENGHHNVSLEEIKASAPRLEMDTDELEDNCIICLQAVEDRTVLPACAHDRMCFECIKKWTEQSRRCPLCNTPIGNHLIHRIRSEYDYQKHFLQPLRSSPPPQHIVLEARAGYRARTRRPSQVEQDNLERAIEKRQWVYRHGLFAKVGPNTRDVAQLSFFIIIHYPFPMIVVAGGLLRPGAFPQHIASNPHTRFRPNPTPSQIASSPELQSRCQMFVRRELRVWPNLDIEFLTSFILSLAKSIDIRTESAVKLISEFLDINGRPSPAGGTVAEHFVHELYSYLRSPFRDLPAYDTVVQYDTPDDIEPPPRSLSREAGPSRSRHRGYSPSPSRRDASLRQDGYGRDGYTHRGVDDPLDASPRDVEDSEMEMDEHWIEVPPSWRGGSRRDSPSRGDSPGPRRSDSRRDRKQDGGRGSSRERARDRKERSPTLGRSPPRRDRRDRSRREQDPSSRKDRSPVSRRDRSPGSRRGGSLMSRRERSPEPSNDKYAPSRGRDEPSRDKPRRQDHSSTRDRKGKRQADEYEQRDRRERDYGDRRSDDERRDRKGKGRERGDGDGMGERGAKGASHRRNEGDEGMPADRDERRWNNDERGWRDNDGRRPDNDAEAPRDEYAQKGADNARSRWDDDNRGRRSGSATQPWGEEKAHRRFSRDERSSHRYDQHGRASDSDSDQRRLNEHSPERPVAGEFDQRPSYSSTHNDDRYSSSRSRPYDGRIPYKYRSRTSHEHDPKAPYDGHPGSSVHVRQGSHEYSRPSKRTRSPSPKSKREETDRDQKRPAVDNHHVDAHSRDSRRLGSPASSTWSANTRPHDDHGAGSRVDTTSVRANDATDGRRARSLSGGAQTRSRSPSRRPAHHNVQEPKTSDVEHSNTAHHTISPFGLTGSGVDQTLSTQPGDNRDKTHPDTRDQTDFDMRDKSRTDSRNRAPRLTPLASIRAHLQGAPRPSEPLSQGRIKDSPTRSTTHFESSATNDPSGPGSGPGPTVLPNAVEKSSMALDDPNRNPIHNDGSSVSHSIFGAAARSQVQPQLITASSSDSPQRVCPSSTLGRNRLLLARLEAIRAATNSDMHALHLSAKSAASPTLADTSGNQSATNSEHDDHEWATSQNRQLGADPADVDTPAARFEVERRLKLQARLAARKREINAVKGAKDASTR
ncbi:unnamed protein product [Rhizoctonia solani]|uniref:RING-type E3 ubiquitin transferase n=1 Tax=Rhizoctonia solani TaxID=456999 RepID=A0A8H3CUQ4_9AGAM|nr:unnamed protein product [Rhizoctonia solani]